jgi:outer membrane receptor protein involved in Fe transport
MLTHFRSRLLTCAAGLATIPTLGHAQTAESNAQTSSPATATAADDSKNIVVTGTRIREHGYNAPTPVTVLGTEEIKAQKPANIAQMLYTLPSVSTTSSNAQTSAISFTAGRAGINSVDLRGLGASRTLLLLDGQRIVPSLYDGTVDLNTFPQDLISRVEIVTGGASAQYGSDAVGGVVNFILDSKFKGFKFGGDAGITNYGDGFNYRVTGSAGMSFLDDRLHVLLNGEYFHQDLIPANDRPWNKSGYQMTVNPAYTPTNGAPELLVGTGIGPTSATSGGLVLSGPLKGTYFLGDGVAKQLNYGAVADPWMIGGDWQVTEEGAVGTNSLQSKEQRIGFFNRTAFDITPNVQVYAQFSWNRSRAAQRFGGYQTLYTIMADNAYLLSQYPQVAASMQANGVNSIDIGRWSDYGFGRFPGTNNKRDVYRYTVGANGKFALGSHPWSWDIYLHHGVTKALERTVYNANVTPDALASDAVFSNGQIVCRSSLTDPSNGCVPLDVLGTAPFSDAALAYITGPEQPWRLETFKLNVVSASLSGELFDLPAGPVALAVGGEWRRQQADGVVGGQYSGYEGGGNYKVQRGDINVKEAFAEISLPIFTGLGLNAAGRVTDYSTSGTVATWKVGANYSPVRDIKFRATYSHDIRAPNMQELFRSPTSFLNTVVFPGNSPAPGPHLVPSVNVGNPDLKPEKANTWTVGVVATPTLVPGLAASVDYWDTKVKDVIGTNGQQQTIDFCYGGLSQFCNNITFTGTVPTAVLGRPTNFAGLSTNGVDIEASYRTKLSAISSNFPGEFRVNALITHYLHSVVDDRIFPIDYAGVIQDPQGPEGGQEPHWVYRVSAFYDINRLSFNLVARGFGSGVYSNEWIQCTSGCPTSTVNNRTINNNKISGITYFDGSARIKLPFAKETELSFIVKNMFNKSPVRVGIDRSQTWLPFPQTAFSLFDVYGRAYRVAVTTKF